MEEIVLYTLLAVIAVSLVSLIGVFTISIKRSVLDTLLPSLVALAAGALLGGAVIHLIPEAFLGLSENAFSLSVLLGVLAFFILERFFHWHHTHHASEEDCHTHDCEIHDDKGYALAPLVLTADALHNVIDGIAIAAAFLVSIEVGVATTIAVMLHEIPQEISDFSLLIHSGMSRIKALVFNFLSALTALLGAGAVLFISSNVENLTPYAAAITAGGFLYIAIGDLVPALHKETRINHALLQLVFFFLGIGIMFLLALGE